MTLKCPGILQEGTATAASPAGCASLPEEPK